LVIAGLDPGIHAASQSARQLSMDHRVKPGGDEVEKHFAHVDLLHGPRRRASSCRHIAENVIAAPAANAANQEYASRRGDSLSPA
jgi:hypothetical protein